MVRMTECAVATFFRCSAEQWISILRMVTWITRNMKIGILSDLHLFNKITNVERVLSKLRDLDLLLIAGDIADRAEEKQYDILLKLLTDRFNSVPIYCVSGNHDNPARDDANYRMFESKINNEYPSIIDESGAFYKYIDEKLDLIGLNPVYHQRQFFFPNKGQQLAFLQKQLSTSSSKYHIVMCHPPLIAHNPQRTADEASYIVGEQDKRLQRIINDKRNVFFISGHTHVSPTVEFDETHNNLYINDGSICPTTVKDHSGEVQQGNVTILNISENELSVIVKGIHTEKVFIEKYMEI